MQINNEMTTEEKKKMLDNLFIDDLEYFRQNMLCMTYDEFVGFLKEFPEFLEDQKEILEIILKMKKDLQIRRDQS